MGRSGRSLIVRRLLPWHMLESRERQHSEGSEAGDQVIKVITDKRQLDCASL